MINAKRVFEFGNGYGYSAFWFTRAFGADGCVNCSDTDAMNRERAERYLSAAALWQRIEFVWIGAQDVVHGSTEAIVEHNRLVSCDPGFDTFINPIRDGVIVARKK